MLILYVHYKTCKNWNHININGSSNLLLLNTNRSPLALTLEITDLDLLSHFSRVWLCATPQTAAHQAPPSLGFSRQEHWSGLPFPSPMRESEVTQSCPTLRNPVHTVAYQAPLSMGFSRQKYWSGVPSPSPTDLDRSFQKRGLEACTEMS